MILLCTQGMSWQVVPEAFLCAPDHFREVHIITTDSPNIQFAEIKKFFAGYPSVHLTITRARGMTDLLNGSDHARFEEILLRWYLSHRNRGPVQVCLAGGYKTISSSMQQAARLFGADNIFHVLATGEIKTLEHIQTAYLEQRLHYIHLGSEEGWPQLRHLDPADYALQLQPHPADPSVYWAEASDLRLRQEAETVLQHSRSLHHFYDLPFPALALLTSQAKNWLYEPLADTPADRQFLQKLPKIELHCHLGGFATHGPALQSIRRQHSAGRQDFPDAPPQPLGWPKPDTCLPLENYMRLGDANGSQLLQDPGCLRAQCRELYQHLLDNRVLYAEIRCSPNNYTSRERSAWTVLQDIRNTFQESITQAAAGNSPFFPRIHLILIATRQDGGDRSGISRHLALAITAAQHWTTGVRVVGVDLAGYETRDTRASLFTTDFEPVHRVGLAVTVHAGENDDAEGIWQAVFKLNARRLGHALRLQESPDLLRAVAERGIGVEMCPYANYQIQGFAPMHGKPIYPLAQYLQQGIKVTVNTDNIGISAASLVDNLHFLRILCPGIRRLDILQITRHALDTAFLPSAEKSQLLSLIQQHLPL